MYLRQRFLFAMLFGMVVLAEPGRVNGCKAEVDASKAKGFFLPVQFEDPKELGVGKLLVASRGLGDPHFARTVILLVHDDEKGAVGLILNRRTDVPLSQVLDLKIAKDRSDPVYVGGPVEPAGVLALMQSPAKVDKAENIVGDISLIRDKDAFETILATRPDPKVFHVYLGYAGWTHDQLRDEVQMGAWFVFPADAAVVFSSDPGSLWLEMIKKTELQFAEQEPLVRGRSSGLTADE